MEEKIIHNCKMCSYYEWNGKYVDEYSFDGKEKEPLDLEGVNGHCFIGVDQDIYGDLLEDFDRGSERDCCVLDIFLVARKDKDLQKANNMPELMKIFLEKHPDKE